ncbi:MAG: hypothetical protein COA78_07140 [Blastopirellula sp.]|nr:MAG: hypothetical protein COA78_07140 [Blastopirellula sp.]
MSLSTSAIEDLTLSGLTVNDIAARAVTPVELAATGYPITGQIPDGYIIPYFDIKGKSIPYYRIKMLGTTVKVKYMGIKDESSHIYFPKGLTKLLDSGADYIIITEGEKKAASAVASGLPCVGLGGVDSWRVRNLLIPANTQLTELKQRKMIKATLPSGDTNKLIMQESGATAEGFEDLVNLIIRRRLCVIIIYDSDKEGVAHDVQRAAAALGYELRYRGVAIDHIRQLVLPGYSDGRKIGLDDYIVARSGKQLGGLISACRKKRTAFPQHPNAKLFINSKLQSGKHTRKDIQDIALSILMELESKGKRLRNRDSGDIFYFDEQTHTLMDVYLNDPRVALHGTAFGGYLYRKYGVGPADVKLIQWLASQFSGEPGMEETSTHKVITRPEKMPNNIAYQLSDTHYVMVTPHAERPFIICENGSNGILFQQNQVEPLDHKEVERRLIEDVDKPLKMLWSEVIDGFNFTVDSDTPTSRMSASKEQSKILAALLFYASPWLFRWNGTQLPVELIVGEAGSGKSSLYGLRQEIICGKPRLTNMTRDIKDWYAGVTGRGGLFVLDNVAFKGDSKDYQQRLSDEMCRLITEPDPRIEVRKLYTTNEIASLPVTATFAITSMAQPFHNVDILQRAAIFQMEAIASTGGHDANWPKRTMALGGGRVGWIAHQLIVIHKFLNLSIAQRQWDFDFRATHRLANYEQALMMMAHVFGIEGSWIPKALNLKTENSMTGADWTLSGLKDFAEYYKGEHSSNFEGKQFSAGEICEWASAHEVHIKNEQITNAWKLGNYMKQHANICKSGIGMYQCAEKRANKTMFALTRKEGDPKL